MRKSREMWKTLRPFLQPLNAQKLRKMPYTLSSPHTLPISFSVLGSGPEHVVFLAGMCMTRESWHPQVDFLATNPRFTLLLPDNCGTGLSKRPKDGYDMDKMAADAIGMVNAVVGPTARVHFVGHSMGAMIAVRAALLAPHRVRSLALLSSHAGGWWWSNVPSLALVRAACVLAMRPSCPLAVAEVGVSLHYTDAFLDELVIDDFTAQKCPRRQPYLERYAEGARSDALSDPDGETFWGQLDAIRRYEILPHECLVLKRAGFPVVVVYGEDDEVVPPRASRELAEKIGALTFRVRGRHFIADESSHDVNAILLCHFGHRNKLPAQPPHLAIDLPVRT